MGLPHIYLYIVMNYTRSLLMAGLNAQSDICNIWAHSLCAGIDEKEGSTSFVPICIFSYFFQCIALISFTNFFLCVYLLFVKLFVNL